MIDWLDYDTDSHWEKEGNRWVARTGGVTLVVENTGWWLFPMWRFSVVLREGVETTMTEAMRKAEKAVAPRQNNILRLVRK